MSEQVHTQPRRPIVGGNWKMNTLLASAVELAEDVVAACSEFAQACDVVVFPPFPYLQAVGRALDHAAPGISLGAQDVYHKANGAFTGEVSTDMLLDLNATWVIVGHSERRHIIGEDDALVNRKLRASMDAGLNVILCVGETLEQRQVGRTDEINIAQLRAGLQGVEAGDLNRLVIAYEPVWAIGTGKTATPADAQAAHRVIRDTLADGYDESLAGRIRIQYGGSVKAANAGELFAQPDIDGGLIGGASLNAAEFTAIVKAAAASRPAYQERRTRA